MKKSFFLIYVLCFACSNYEKVDFVASAQKPVNLYDNKLVSHDIDIFNFYKANIPFEGDSIIKSNHINKFEFVIKTNNYSLRFHDYSTLIRHVDNLLKADGYKFNKKSDMLYFLIFNSDEKYFAKLNSNPITYTLSEFKYNNKQVIPLFNSKQVSCFLLKKYIDSRPFNVILYIDEVKNTFVCIELNIVNEEMRTNFKKTPNSLSEKMEFEDLFKKTELEMYKIMVNISILRKP